MGLLKRFEVHTKDLLVFFFLTNGISLFFPPNITPGVDENVKEIWVTNRMQSLLILWSIRCESMNG